MKKLNLLLIALAGFLSLYSCKEDDETIVVPGNVITTETSVSITLDGETVEFTDSSEKTVILKVGAKITIKISDGSSDVCIWKSNDEKVATVEGDVITGVGVGSTDIVDTNGSNRIIHITVIE